MELGIQPGGVCKSHSSLKAEPNLSPTASYGGPSKFAAKVHDAGVNWSAEGDLSFLNDW
jgi:hypothetical protein